MFDYAAEAERLVRCFDPDVHLAEGTEDHLIISPRWGRLRRRDPLLVVSPCGRGAGEAWKSAREKLLTSRDRSIQLAISTYQYRVRMRTCVPLETLRRGEIDLHRHCHALLDRHGNEKAAVTVRREEFWIRSLPPDEEGRVQFEFGNTFLIPITAAAIAAEASTLVGART
ncbi:MAG TPA: hypothetical protein VMD92_18470 [Acidobacteriaceae bacterium]|nr:hypothetical protein [Acidobacteriaceae bacterium]